MKTPLLNATLCVGLALPAAASAQDFLGALARRAAESAAQGLVNRAVSAATTPRPPAASPGAQQPTAGSPVRAPASGGALPADFPAPRPLNYSPALRSVDDLRFSDEDKAGKVEFEAIGRYACSDCEGGRSYDSWPEHEIPGIGVSGYALENRLGALAVGEALRWTGSRTRTRYAITVTSERGIGPWECKQLLWTGDRGDQHVERRGLICKATENWHTMV